VALLAVAVSAGAGARVRDPLASVGIAIAASLVVLPVTWYHYPVALIPVGIALVLRVPARRAHVAIGVVVADLAIACTPLLWASVALVVAALHTRRTSPARERGA